MGGELRDPINTELYVVEDISFKLTVFLMISSMAWFLNFRQYCCGVRTTCSIHEIISKIVLTETTGTLKRSSRL